MYLLNKSLLFSDAAKFAEVARNLVKGNGYGSYFSFFSNSIFENINKLVFPSYRILPVMPYSMAAFFKILGVGDLAVRITSIFYFILTLIFVYLLTRKLYKNSLISRLSTIAVGFSYDLINYATNGASESPFIFELVAATYFVSIKKKWATILTILILVLMYFTRPHAFIYITGIILYWLLLNFNIKRTLIYFGLVVFGEVFFDLFILNPLSGNYFIYSIFERGSVVLSQIGVSQSASDQLRSGVVVHNFLLIDAFKKIFYNLYNFYKLLPQIINPYLLVFFLFGLFSANKDKTEKSFKIISTFIVVTTFLVVSASVPFFRYIHPIIPLVYIISVASIVNMLKQQIDNYKHFKINKLEISKQAFLVFVSSCLVLFFGVGQTLGIFLLDLRFKKNNYNYEKPPVYVKLSEILKENTSSDQTIITNLDTWGSWYGNRKTVWFPLEPEQIINPMTGKIPFDAIYLTSYLINDENYYMGVNWKLLYDNPENPNKWICKGCSEIANEFKLKKIYKIDPNQNYEQQDATGVLFIKK